jgi:hypothetical protein
VSEETRKVLGFSALQSSPIATESGSQRRVAAGEDDIQLMSQGCVKQSSGSEREQRCGVVNGWIGRLQREILRRQGECFKGKGGGGLKVL